MTALSSANVVTLSAETTVTWMVEAAETPTPSVTLAVTLYVPDTEGVHWSWAESSVEHPVGNPS